jgi:hypothetical protein
MLVLYAILRPDKRTVKKIGSNGEYLLKIYNPKKEKWTDIEFDSSAMLPVENVLGWIEE